MLQHRWTLLEDQSLTHEGLEITDKEFDIVVNQLAATLKEFKVPEGEHDEVMAKIGNLRSYIVERKS